MQILSDEEVQFRQRTTDQSKQKQKIEIVIEYVPEVPKDLIPKETYQEWKAKREITARQEYAASQEKAEPIGEVGEVEVIVDKEPKVERWRKPRNKGGSHRQGGQSNPN